jgi:hypothetical protein
MNWLRNLTPRALLTIALCLATAVFCAGSFTSTMKWITM